jgi:hypothetical protein
MHWPSSPPCLPGRGHAGAGIAGWPHGAEGARVIKRNGRAAAGAEAAFDYARHSMPGFVRAHQHRGIANDGRYYSDDIRHGRRAQERQAAAIGHIPRLIKVEDVRGDLVFDIQMRPEPGSWRIVKDVYLSGNRSEIAPRKFRHAGPVGA